MTSDSPRQKLTSDHVTTLAHGRANRAALGSLRVTRHTRPRRHDVSEARIAKEREKNKKKDTLRRRKYTLLREQRGRQRLWIFLRISEKSS